MCRVHTEHAALDLVELERPVDALPEIGVLDRYLTAVRLPPPPISTPQFQGTAQAAVHLTAGGDQRDLRGLRQGLQSSDDRQQLKPLLAGRGFLVRGLKLQPTIDGLENKVPSSLLAVCPAVGSGQK
jgi:hypothetical protein